MDNRDKSRVERVTEWQGNIHILADSLIQSDLQQCFPIVTYMHVGNLLPLCVSDDLCPTPFSLVWTLFPVNMFIQWEKLNQNNHN